MRHYSLGTVALSALLLIAAAGCHRGGNGSASGNLGTVDGEPITNDEFFSYLQHKPVVQVAAQGRSISLPVAGMLGVQAMRDLVQQKMLGQIAKDEGVLPTKEDIDKELEFHKKQNANYIENLEHAGLTMDDIRNDTLNSLTSERLQTKGVVVGDAEARKYIKDNPATFTTPAQANLLVIAVNDTKKKESVDADLKGGQTFAAVAMQNSILPNAKQTGGAYDEHNVTAMPVALQSLVKATPAGRATDWQKQGTTWIKFYVSSKSPAKPMPVDSTLVEEVQRELAKRKGNQANNADLQKKIIAKIKDAKVVMGQSAYQEGWDQYRTQLAAAAAGAGH